MFLHQRMSHPNSSTSPSQEPPSSLQRIDHHHELWLHRGDTVYDVHQETIVLTLSFSASIESVMTCNSTQLKTTFRTHWDSIDSRLVGESRLNQARPDESYHHQLHLYPPTVISIYSSLSTNFIIIIIIIMKVTDTS